MQPYWGGGGGGEEIEFRIQKLSILGLSLKYSFV